MSAARNIAVIGGGPAGLMAAETLALRGAHVTVYDRMPSLARKFLMAGRGGLNIAHSEDYEKFLTRYGEALAHLSPALDAFRPHDLRQWCTDLGIDTFVGSSGRVFPKEMKASPLLRAWLRRLDGLGVKLQLRCAFRGWDAPGRLVITSPDGERAVQADATVLALGGASWPRLGSDGGWTAILESQGVAIAPLRAANCGFETRWSDEFAQRFAGTPLKNISLHHGDRYVRGECVLTSYGLEGGAIYALSAPIRETIARAGQAEVCLDLRPDQTTDQLARKLAAPRGKASLSNYLRKRLGLSPAEVALLRETGAPLHDPAGLAAHIKAVPLALLRTRPLDRAISTAGGVRFNELDARFMLRKLPGVFCAGEMLDWEAPTGGYLLQACFATGKAAGQGAAALLERP